MSDFNLHINDLTILCFIRDYEIADKIKLEIEKTPLNFEWHQCAAHNHFLDQVEKITPSLVFIEQHDADISTEAAFKQIKKKHPYAAFILLTNSANYLQALELTRLGVDDCIFDNDFKNIETKVYNAIKRQKEQQEHNIHVDVINSISESSTIGGWHLDVLNQKVQWTSITKKIHQLDEDYKPDINTSINFYKEGWSRDAIAKAVNNASINGESYDLELILITAKGTEKWVRTIGKPILENGRCIYLYGTIEDITQKRFVKRSLNITNQRLTALLNNLSGSTFQYKVNKNGEINVLFASNQIQELHEVNPEEVLGNATKIQELIHPESREKIIPIITNAIANKKEYNCVFRANIKSDTVKWIETLGVPSIDDDDDTILYSVISWDVTQKINREKELEKLSIVAKETTNCVIITDKDGFTEWVNEGFTKFSGYKLEEIIGKKPGAVLQGPNTDPKHIEYLRICIQKQESGYCEILNYRKNDSPYWVEIYLTPIFNEQGELQKFIAIQNDVTKRKFHDEQLKETNYLLNETINELKYQKHALDEHSIVAITDVQGTITYANQKFCSLSKYSLRELIGKNHRILNSGEHSKAFFKEMYSTIANGKTWHGEIKNKAKDGTYYWVDTTIVPFISQKTGKPEHYVSIRTDITHVKQNQAKLIQLNNKYEQVIQATNDAILEWNIEKDEIIGINMFSRLKDETLRLSDVIAKIHEDDRANVKKSILDSLNNPSVFQWEQEYRIMLKNGSEKYVYDRAQISRDKNGKAIKMIGASQDITEKMKYLKRLKEKNKRLMQIAWTQSHEMRAPLANILGIINLLDLFDIEDDELKSYIQKLDTSAVKLDNVIKKIVEMAQFIEDEEF